MAEQTLLTMVQNILSAMSSDEVNSISDTTESMQVAQIIENKYYDIAARGDLTQHETLFQLNPSNNPALPTEMFIPSGISKINWLQYYDTNPNDNTQTGQFGAYSHNLNTDIVSTSTWTTTSASSVLVGLGTKGFFVPIILGGALPVIIGQGVLITSGTNSMFGSLVSYNSTLGFMTINVTSVIGSGTFSSWIIQSSNTNSVPGYRYVTIVPIDYFLDVTNRFDITQNNVKAYTFTQSVYNFTFKYRTDLQPTMAVVLSNNYVLFDSLDSTQDSTLQASKTLAFGDTVPPFVLSDTFVPDLDDQQFPLLLNEAKSLAFYELKQMPHQKADQEIKRQWTVVQKSKSVANKPGYFDQIPSFGRVPRTGGYGGYPIYRWMRGSLGGAIG